MSLQSYYDWGAVLPGFVQLQEVPGMSQNDLETPAYEPEVWRSTTQGLGALYSRKSTMAVVSTETRRTAATASSLREKSRALAMSGFVRVCQNLLKAAACQRAA